MASCATHPEFEAKGQCVRCGRSTCAACERILDGRTYCLSCEGDLVRRLGAQGREAVLPPLPPPGLPEAGAAVPRNVPLGPPPSLVRPIAFAIAAGLLGAVAWYLSVRYSNYKLGLIAVGVGWLVGRAAVFGGDGRGGRSIAIASVAVAFSAMVFGEYLIVNHFAHEAFAAEMPDAKLPAFLGLSGFFSIYGETIGVMDVVFYALGAYEAWKLPAAAR